MKLLRYILGFFILFAILTAIAISKEILFIISIFFIILALQEYRNMFKTNDISIHKFIPELIGIILAYIFIYNKHIYVTPVIVVGIFLSFFITIVKNKKPYIKTTFGTIMGFLFTFSALYIVKLFYFFPENKFNFILVYFSAVLLGDFSASKIGPLFKNKLLAPEISPNKTIAGSISNIFFSCLTCLLLIKLFNFNFFDSFFLGCTISVFSQIGDLSVSLIKRDLGIKHSGSLFLNYGGILDRVDAFIFSAPATYYCLIIISLLKIHII